MADFGLAKATSSQSHQLTQAGMVVGTPYFMSPEQCQGKPVDARSDIYSLGATYYSLLTGENPYQDSAGVPQLMYAHCHHEPPDPRTVDDTIPAACSRIVAKAMAKAPEDRYQTVKEMLADLEMVNATLSGNTLSTLPSESGSHAKLSTPEAAPVAPRSPARRSPALLFGGGGVLLCLVAALFMWGPWKQGTTPNQGEANPAAVLSTEPIKIGILHSLRGTMANSEMVVVEALMFAIEEINAAGGVMGRPLKPVVADGGSDPALFAREAERLITQEKVATLFGCWTSASRKMVKPVVEEHEHLLIYPLQYEGLESSPNIIYMGAAPNQQILPAIAWAATKLGKKRFFLVGSDYVFPRAANEIIKDDLKRLGVEVVGELYLPLGSAEVKAMTDDIVAAKPDMILNTINGDTNVAFFRALRRGGILSTACPTLSFSIGEVEVRNLDSMDIEGDYTAWTYFENLDTPENQKFVTKFHEKYPQRRVTDPMESAYSGLKLWAMAVNDAQSLEPKKIRRAMLEQRFSAPSGEVRIDTDTQHSYKTPRIGQIQPNGRIEIVWQESKHDAPNPFPQSRTATQWLAFLHDLHSGWGNQWSAP